MNQLMAVSTMATGPLRAPYQFSPARAKPALVSMDEPSELPVTVSSRASGGRPLLARWALMRSMQYCSAAATSAETGGATHTGGMAVGGGGPSVGTTAGGRVGGTNCCSTTTTGVTVTTEMTP